MKTYSQAIHAVTEKFLYQYFNGASAFDPSFSEPAETISTIYEKDENVVRVDMRRLFIKYTALGSANFKGVDAPVTFEVSGK